MKLVTLHFYFVFNPFVPNAPYLYSLKALKNLLVFWCFQRVEKGCIGNEKVEPFSFFRTLPIVDFKTKNFENTETSITEKSANITKSFIFFFQEQEMFTDVVTIFKYIHRKCIPWNLSKIYSSTSASLNEKSLAEVRLLMNKQRLCSQAVKLFTNSSSLLVYFQCLLDLILLIVTYGLYFFTSFRSVISHWFFHVKH